MVLRRRGRQCWRLELTPREWSPDARVVEVVIRAVWRIPIGPIPCSHPERCPMILQGFGKVIKISSDAPDLVECGGPPRSKVWIDNVFELSPTKAAEAGSFRQAGSRPVVPHVGRSWAPDYRGCYADIR
jgi:hypothetical protein